MGLYLIARWLMDKGYFTLEEVPFALIGMGIILFVNLLVFLVVRNTKPMTGGLFPALLSAVFTCAGQFAQRKYIRGSLFLFAFITAYLYIIFIDKNVTVGYVVAFCLLATPIESFFFTVEYASIGRSKKGYSASSSGYSGSSRRSHDVLDDVMETQEREFHEHASSWNDHDNW
ncbi:hypothetical protein [Radiobacillus sp. PE A8.2]|uniref:hypothetical protein n=1 Tax=Radiobacillus sp. PE A8.2 TaxID=3380349 RepID=UPI00388F23AD